MKEKLVIRFASVARALRVMLGAPDYERYLEHVATEHCGASPMSRDEFVRERMENRYSRPGSRCC
ncbi:MAG: YbdD/YjiX family protein [Thermoanaerobaculia bacterium]